MNFLKCNQLSSEQIKQYRELEQTCRQHDRLERTAFLSNELNFNTQIDSFYLLYEGNTLVGVLSMFLPTKDASEISAYTLPEYRHRGCFHLLLQTAEEELKKYGINQILFVQEPQSKDAQAVLNHYQAKYAYTEYLMTYDRTVYQEKESRIRLFPAEQANATEMASIDSVLFEEDYDESLSMTEKSIASPHIEQYCAFLDDTLVGICNANLENGDISIYGVGIKPEFQGKGYGRELLNLLLGRLLRHKDRNITLEVSSRNEIAYRLYITSGFRAVTQYDYYTYSI